MMKTSESNTVQSYLKRKPRQSQTGLELVVRTSRAISQETIKLSRCRLLFYFILLFPPSVHPKHCAVSGRGKLWTKTTSIVHCQRLSADTDLVASVGCSSPSLSEFAGELFCAVAGPRKPLPTGLAHELCWVSALHWVVGLSLLPSIPHAAFQASGCHEQTVAAVTSNIKR